jgi:hypothetical protein
VNVHVNLDADAYLVTREKLRILLEKHSRSARVVDLARWFAALAATMLIALASNSFQDFLLSNNVWRAGFAIAGIGSIVAAAISGLVALLTRRDRNLDALLDELKAGEG